MKRNEMILHMFCTQYEVLRSEVETLQQHLRFRRISSLDCLELIIAIERFEQLREISKWVFQILRIDDDGYIEDLYQQFLKEQKNKIVF